MSLENKVSKTIENLNFSEIDFRISEDRIVHLNGKLKAWHEVVKLGHAVAKIKGVRNVVNDVVSEDYQKPQKDNAHRIQSVKATGKTSHYDVAIIGAGISGCSIAQALGKYNLKTVVVEKNSDIADEATKANNGNIHPGILAKPGTLKAKLNLEGNKMYTKLAEDLSFELERPGSLVVFHDEKDWKRSKFVKFLRVSKLGYLIKPLWQIVKTPDVEWLEQEALRKLEPNLKGNPVGGIWMKTMGLVEPYEVCLAFAENAAENGVEFKLDSEVLQVQKVSASEFEVITENETITCHYVINCAGVYADEIAEMVNDRFYTIHPRRGAIAILDKRHKGFINTPSGLFLKHKNSNTKGGGASVTPEGNMLWGPTAYEVPDKEDKSVEASDVEYILNLGKAVTDELGKGDIITMFSGIRAPDYKEDFIIEASKKVNGFIHVAGIQSPGLASAPAIAKRVERILKKLNKEMTPKEHYISTRKPLKKFRDLSYEEKDRLIKENPKYGNIVCRCELITEGEIIEAVHSIIPATSVDGIKRRTRAGMGRCQGGFCGPRVLEIMAREKGVPLTEITLKGRDTSILTTNSRSELRGDTNE